MKKYILMLLFQCVVVFAHAQYFQTGQDPASIKWRQILTQNFQLIYPDYYEIQAQQLANVLEKVYQYESKSIPHKPKKISVILHTQAVKSNGLVAWAPKRSEFYTSPHQGIYAQDWLHQLALHEFRHVVQIDKINEELPGIIKFILGEQGTALVFGIYLPWWYIEGDAVVAETTASKFGRGRFPSFLMLHKAQVLEKGVYKYDKAYNGSIKDFVPDHYKLGYYVVGASMERYGNGLWNSVLTHVGQKPFSLNAFNKALKKETGFNKVELYNSVFDSLALVWQKEDQKFVPQAHTQISKQSAIYTNYTYNHWINNTDIVSFKTSLNGIPHFVRIDNNGREKKLIVPGALFDESINYRYNWITWAERLPDPRWAHSGKSAIQLYNIETKAKKTIQTEYKAFAPSISHDMTELAVVESDFSNNYYLSVYNINNGELQKRISTQENNFILSPDWINKKELVAVVLTNDGKRVVKFNLDNGESEQIVDLDMGEIKQLYVVKNKLFFIGAYTGKNALYVLDLTNGKIELAYEPRFGTVSPTVSPNGEFLALSDYTADGFRILKIKNDKSKYVNLGDLEKAHYSMADNLSKQESGVLDLSPAKTDLEYESKNYNKLTHLFNFHSWAPLAIDVNSYEFKPGVSLMSQNKLGTSISTLGYEWDISEETGKIFGKYTYKGWYPVVDIEINSGKRASYFMLIENIRNGYNEIVRRDTSLQRYKWNERTIEFDLRLPLNLSRGKYTRLLQPEIEYDLSSYTHDESTPEDFFEGDFQSLTYRLYYQQLLRQSYQDVYPDFGFTTDLRFYHSPLGDSDLGNMILAQSLLFAPGLLPNHGIRFYIGAHKKDPEGTLSFTDAIRYPRGWRKLNSTDMISFGVDYKLPVFYPEVNLGGLVYVKRINASIFADYANLKGNYFENGKRVGTYTSEFSSYGMELMADLNMLRFYAPIKFGARASYLPEVNNVFVDLLFSIDFTAL